MYSIILVDDEEEVRKSIIKQIDWKTIGFEVVGDASNGRDAEELIEIKEPDLVMTDIKMPYMDGLQLCQWIREEKPWTKVIIFSGFDDFEYAKTAIKYDVVEYVLKPVNVNELTEILRKVKQNLDKEIEEKRNVSFLMENYKKSLPILKEQFFNDLFNKNYKVDYIEQRMKDLELHINPHKNMIVFAIDIENSDKLNILNKERNLVPIFILQFLKDKLGVYDYEIFSSMSESSLAGVISIDNEKELIDLFNNISKEVKKVLNIYISVGVGEVVDSVDKLRLSYKSAIDALGYKAIVGLGSVIYIKDIQPKSVGKLDFDSISEAELSLAIKFGSREKIERTVTKLIQKMEEAKVHSNQRQIYTFAILNSIIQLIKKYEISIENIFGNELVYIKVLENLQNSEEFYVWLLRISIEINRRINDVRAQTTNNIITKAKEYIYENYSDPELSVESISSYLHLSAAYFSTIFKKETGQSYVNFLTEVRLNKAVELLNETDDKTYVIANKVGYQEQNYFSYVFKKRFGTSPSKFRGNDK